MTFLLKQKVHHFQTGSLLTAEGSLSWSIKGSNNTSNYLVGERCQWDYLRKALITWHIESFWYMFIHSGDFPGCPAVKKLPFNAGNVSLIPGWRTNITHVWGQLSLCTSTGESPQATIKTQCSQKKYVNKCLTLPGRQFQYGQIDLSYWINQLLALRGQGLSLRWILELPSGPNTQQVLNPKANEWTREWKHELSFLLMAEGLDLLSTGNMEPPSSFKW